MPNRTAAPFVSPALGLVLVPAALLLGVASTVHATAQAPTEHATDANVQWHDLKKGLRYADLVVGDGAEARRGKQVTVHYVGRFAKDGTVFQSSRDSNSTFAFRLGNGQVIRGWELGMEGMKVGGVRRLLIPAKLGYGRRGIKGRIPPDTDLEFEIELLSVTN